MKILEKDFKMVTMRITKRTYLISAVVALSVIIPLVYHHKKTNTQVKGIKTELAQVNLTKLKQIQNQKYHPIISQGAGNESSLSVSAKSAIVVDNSTGNVLFEKDISTKRPPASIAKILTAIVATETMDLNKRLKVSESAANMEPNKVYLGAGEEIRLEDLLICLMTASANDAAEVIAENFPGGRSAFIDKLNEKIIDLGLTNTHYKNPSGLDEDGFYTSALDMATIVRYAIDKTPDVIRYAGIREYTVPGTEDLNYEHYTAHISDLLKSYPYMIASKPGFTYNAGHTLIGIAQRNNKKIVMIYLDSNDGMNDGTNLFEYGFSKLGV
ncbi:hypothetical protein COZ22_01000 [bacterium (Candidatus Howlettbacteria) CG_4_10_14_3_um_filter_37_10]|nr:MAG: hypothetical protein COX25_05290 [bacterium (Candidatus Howlettbacteria) CG23_combo_of_CG06-09_8_20_14_all_37_9]PIY00132.1 MAG: hypothetical protein COZ22_01000 [bacterium (Candidatus Howlettbacteria) CG_4_10_14_3_um_filter_37_10]PJB06747.1 MAG: hypothetical protein CO123_01490 [bacterium (Candidatus Howlettbacteria) CG_4_9_14_3_um_filter_37_10]